MDKKSDAFQGLAAKLKSWVQLAPLITELRGAYMRERHWEELLGLAQKTLQVCANTKLSQMEDLNLLAFQGSVEEITDKVRCKLWFLALSCVGNHWRNSLCRCCSTYATHGHKNINNIESTRYKTIWA